MFVTETKNTKKNKRKAFLNEKSIQISLCLRLNKRTRKRPTSKRFKEIKR